MAANGNESGDANKFSRLPKTVLPVHYSITLKPDLESFTFAGHETIKVKVHEATDTVFLNSLDVQVNSASFRANDGKEFKASDCQTNDDTGLLTIKFDSKLPVGDGELFIDFIGNHNDKMAGFYRCKTTKDGKDEFSVVTQFEPTDARRAFPCWDEPAIKAKFEMTLIVHKDKTALSNMDVVSESVYDKDPNYKVLKFDNSPIMSTYLVAAAVGDYDFVEGTTSDGIKCRVYTQKTKSEQGRFALDVALRILPFYKDYFGIAYPLTKMDCLAVPDFSVGAMENWGLVTYRESCFLNDPTQTSTGRKQSISHFVAHEFAHQWFGNLVTMEWWTCLWLNEGFARFMQYLCLDNLYPEYQIWTQFVSDVLNSALHLDGLHTSHPIEVPVNHPSEIDQIFDSISYDKGASVIRMVYHYVGAENFKIGLRNYFKKFSYQNTVTEDLWVAFEQASKKPVERVMNTWVKQKGYPVITVEEKQVGNDRVLSLKQEKFCSNGKPCEADQDTIWPTPIAVIKQSNPTETVAEMLLETKTAQLTVKNVKPNEWIKLNPATICVYRTQYSAEMLSKFYPAIESKELPALDRYGVLSDLFALVQSGQASTIDALKLLKSYVNEDSYTVWCCINSCYDKLNILLSKTDCNEDFLAYGRQLFSKISEKLGFESRPDDDHLTKLLRTLILNSLASIEHKEFEREAIKRFERHCNGEEGIPADMRAAVYRAVAAKADHVVFEKFLELHRKADLHDEKNRILVSLGVVKDEALVQKLVEFLISDEVRPQDIVYGFMGLTYNPKSSELVWKFYQKEFELLKTRCISGPLQSSLVKSSTAGFATEEKAREVKAFFEQNKLPSAERAIEQSIESIRLKAEWLTRDSDAIIAYLKANNSSD